MDRKHEGGHRVVFRLGADDVSALRFGVSPGYELARAVIALQAPGSTPLQWGWLREVRRRVPVDAYRTLAAMVPVVGFMPDFLTRSPAWDMTPADELAALRATTRAQVRADLALVHEREPDAARRQVLAGMLRHPDRTRARVADAWEAVWESLLAPYWPTLHRLLTADITLRSRTVIDHGTAAMVAGLHERVSWRPTEVRVQMRKWSGVVDCAGRGLLLVPSVFGVPHCATLTREPSLPTVFYPAHGVTELWVRERRGAQALAGVLGEARAAVLAGLDGPLSTSQVAAVRGLAVSTAHHHLTRLRDAGLTSSRRAGGQVLHTRTLLGDALVAGP